ncbi:putative methyltransferase, putative,mRNA cap methyltransferase-like protein [Trypanosoma rangeli]|uniref:mRNA (guanine-N(7))-methyltransferase n=1 Tax=Trypanosoma rangeli TaxID=5698 RepID=A0A422N4N7_TRYRA|nr:putative methyltransferase, putative,mRNA cap methyltransferase-like protein [Trypanosoma rangeli]RNF00410.1 putative methyltransferase, putative,mRNA cap methyltransferase-like protein [Trypanosoma rangeli]|eukprot:RNF00410.1 putative methyltransferase, putative,mRNA cap methyltransferase-like protein [Trypanosoma rangeli]
MNSLDSLLQLHNEAENVFGQRLLLPVDEEFVHSLHGDSLTAVQRAGHGSFHASYHSLLQRTRHHSSGVSPGIPQLLFSYVAEAVAGSRNGEFMGPLCVPMRKSHAATLRSEEYFLMEKSDGTRAILVSFCVQAFPCWVLRGGNSWTRNSLRLDDVAALEDVRQLVCQSTMPSRSGWPLQLSLGAFYVESKVTISPDGEVETFTLKPCPATPSAAAAATNNIMAERRLGTRHMGYCFDRSMTQAYLLLEEYAVPSLLAFAVDGEIMIAVSDVEENGTKPIFGCFDVFRYTQMKDAEDGDTPLTRWPMSKRYEVLRNLIVAPMHPVENARTPAPCLRIFAKQMFPIKKFARCVSRIHRVDTGEKLGVGEYYYDGPHGLTRNDGFIFTPEKFDLVQGARKEQLKWKWPSLLSVDWSITAIADRTDEYTVNLFFRKRRFGHTPDSVGCPRLSSAMRLLNPFSLRIPTGNSVVAECMFDRKEKCWSIERLRTDKTEPNSVVTVISVLESLVEDITLEVLIDLIGVTDTLLASEVQSLQGDAEEGVGKTNTWSLEPISKHNTCQLTLRATQLQTPGNHELYLYWAVRIPSERQCIPCIHCKVSECTGLGFTCPAEDETSKLTENLYIALANAGGSYAWSDFTVDAVFDGDTGRWNIVSLHPTGDNRKSTYVGIIEHLQYLLVHGREAVRAIMAFADEQQIYSATNMPMTSLLEKTNNHYACKTRELSAEKSRSALRLFNNWVKNVLITNAVAYFPLQRGYETNGDGLAVADLCSGRGGDLFKWRAHQPWYLFMVDSCLDAVAESAARYSISRGLSVKGVSQGKSNPGVFAYFTVCDVFDEKGALEVQFENFFNTYLKGRRLDIISCQFSLHYGCSTEERTTCFLRAVSAALRPGGVFIGTTVSDAELRRRLAEHGPVFGNSVYTVRFPMEAPPEQSFGVQYSVSVEESVTELPEYLVPWERLVTLCGSLGLQLVESLGFMEYRDLHYHTPKGQELRDVAVVGGRRDYDGHALLSLSSEEEEAASLFRTFLFLKS